MIDAFLAFLGDSVFLAHNVPFDFGMVNRVLHRMGRSRLTNCTLDTRDLAILLMPDQPSHKLSLLGPAMGIPHPDAHRALADAEVVVHLFNKMVHMLHEINPLVLRDTLNGFYVLNLNIWICVPFLMSFMMQISVQTIWIINNMWRPSDTCF